MPLELEIAGEALPQDEFARLAAAAQAITGDAGVTAGEISLMLVRDAQMHALNRRHLDHDYTTDVLSFVFERTPGMLLGEIIANRDYAAREAARYGWREADELLLYFIHGCLHLVGMDDQDDAGRQAMRAAEARYLAPFGLAPPWNEG